jgi:lipopolysaccharide transport system permease protein
MTALAPARLASLRELVWHLAKREVAIAHRFTLLGWAWPLTRQLAQLGVLVFVFGRVLDLGIEDYPLYVFSGLVAWGWFAAGLQGATTSLLERRHLVFQSGFPPVVIPLVAVTVPLIDVLLALPVLLVMLVASGVLEATALLFPLLLAVQLVLMAGIALVTSSLSVYLRDIPNVVGVALLLLFYVTPVFFDISRVPEDYQWVLRLNPLAVLLEADRAVLMGTDGPPVAGVVLLAVLSGLLVAVGLALFRRLTPGLYDEL